MKIVHVETLISAGPFPASSAWKRIRRDLHRAVKAVDWPPGSGQFTIYPESGKKRGEGNGVKPIKLECIRKLLSIGWLDREPSDIAIRLKPGDVDAIYYCRAGTVAMEWETGNISSSHRAMNKLAMGLMKGLLVAGTLVVPSRRLYHYLTDRIGNFDELQPYFDLWRAVRCRNGVLEIVVIEQDAESRMVPRIPKGTDGRSQV